jgi:ribosomal protein L37AE/L43A
MLTLALRILRFVNRAYPFVAFGVYALAFLVAFICVFSFPLGALTLVVTGVLSLAFVSLCADALKALERLLARRQLRRGRCPACRLGPVDAEAAGSWCCRGCATRFEADGSQAEPQAADDGAAMSAA